MKSLFLAICLLFLVGCGGGSDGNNSKMDKSTNSNAAWVEDEYNQMYINRKELFKLECNLPIPISIGNHYREGPIGDLKNWKEDILFQDQYRYYNSPAHWVFDSESIVYYEDKPSQWSAKWSKYFYWEKNKEEIVIKDLNSSEIVETHRASVKVGDRIIVRTKFTTHSRYGIWKEQ